MMRIEDVIEDEKKRIEGLSESERKTARYELQKVMDYLKVEGVFVEYSKLPEKWR